MQPFLQHSYFVVAVAIVIALVILRIILLRWRHQTLADFFRLGSGAYGAQPQSDSNYGSLYHGLQLAQPPAAYHPDRRVRAADTDAYGRRLGLAGDNLDGKDALPAYDNVDRPPKYIEAGWTHGGPLPRTESSAVIQSSHGEQSGTAHSNTAHGAPAVGVSRHGHTMADETSATAALSSP